MVSLHHHHLPYSVVPRGAVRAQLSLPNLLHNPSLNPSLPLPLSLSLSPSLSSLPLLSFSSPSLPLSLPLIPPSLSAPKTCLYARAEIAPVRRDPSPRPPFRWSSRRSSSPPRLAGTKRRVLRATLRGRGGSRLAPPPPLAPPRHYPTLALKQRGFRAAKPRAKGAVSRCAKPPPALIATETRTAPRRPSGRRYPLRLGGGGGG